METMGNLIYFVLTAGLLFGSFLLVRRLIRAHKSSDR